MKILTKSNQKWWVLVGVSIASFLGCIDFTIVNTALPAIQTALDASVNQLQWIINIFVLALSTCMVVMGRLADIYGRRLILYIGMIVFGLASLGAGLSTSIYWLILFRLFQGISCAILYTTTGAIVSHAFPASERGKAIGLLFGVNGIGLAIGPMLGGIIVSALSWHWIFFINVPLIIVSFLICSVSVNESRNTDESATIDWLGLILLMIGLPCLILALIQGDNWGWFAPNTVGLFILAILMLVAFCVVENRATYPIVKFSLLANRIFISSIVATFALAFFYCTAFFLMPLYLHAIRLESGYMVGMMLLPTTLMVALLSPVIGKVVDKYGPKLPLVLGLIFFAISAIIQAQFTANSSVLLILSAFTLMGVGWACILGPSTVAALSALPENMGAVALGTSWTFHNIGGAVGLALGIIIYRSGAQKSLLSQLANYPINGGEWIKDVVANPDGAIGLLQKYLTVDIDKINSIFHQFFMAGYQSAMLLLATSSLVASLIIFFVMKKKK